MRKAIAIITTLFFQQSIFPQSTSDVVRTQTSPDEIRSQSPHDLIRQVLQAQQGLRTVAYKLKRTDTLVTGQTRIITGLTRIQMAAGDSLFGFWFWTKRDDVNAEAIYDGNTGVEVDHNKKEYKMFSDRTSLENLPYHYGQVLFPELIKLDTSRAAGFDLTQDQQYYYLTMHLPDITQYDVTNRYKRFSIDKRSMLPVRMKNHQETVGKVQDLTYEVVEIWVNKEEYAYDFSGLRFPKDYQPTAGVAKLQGPSILGKPAPPFSLVSFQGEKTASDQITGKVILLDFGEVWCGHCLESMPKVQALYDKYKEKGLIVMGVSFEKEQTGAFSKMCEKLHISFPMLIGDAAMRKAYEVEGVPKYVLIDKSGYIGFVTLGFSDVLETEIAKRVGEK